MRYINLISVDEFLNAYGHLTFHFHSAFENTATYVNMQYNISCFLKFEYRDTLNASDTANDLYLNLGDLEDEDNFIFCLF